MIGFQGSTRYTNSSSESNSHFYTPQALRSLN